MKRSVISLLVLVHFSFAEHYEWDWELPSILERNSDWDIRLTNCMPDKPKTLCKNNVQNIYPFKERNLSSSIIPPWLLILDSYHEIMQKEISGIPRNHFIPYCHHHDICHNPSWKIMPLMILNYKVQSNLALAPITNRLLETLAQNIPGLISVAFSLSESTGHIRPHCDYTEGIHFVRHLYGITVPKPNARFNICDNVYEFSEKTLFSFNNSQPHEIINPSKSPRIVLLIDVLLDHIHTNEIKQFQTFELLQKDWNSTLSLLQELDLKEKGEKEEEVESNQDKKKSNNEVNTKKKKKVTAREFYGNLL